MLRATIAAMLISSPASADICKDIERISREWSLAVGGLSVLIPECKGKRTRPCKGIVHMNEEWKKSSRLGGGMPIFTFVRLKTHFNCPPPERN